MSYGLQSSISAALDVKGIEPTAERTLLIATTPRTGGHFLCSRLAADGLGMPTEYFGPQLALPLLGRWTGEHFETLAEATPQASVYSQKLLSLRSPNTVFSAKLFFGDLRFLRKCFSQERLQQATYLFLVRQDIVAQTISLLALLKTGRAFDSEETIDFINQIETIDQTVAERTLNWIIQQNQMWCHYLATLSNVLWTDMETSIQRPDEIAHEIAHHMSIEVTPTPLRAETKRYQRDKDLKQSLDEHFSSHLRQFVRDQNYRFTPPQNARRVC
jgi:LPS sulfotransferase NodH